MAYDISSWGLQSSPKDSIPKMLENFRALKDDAIVSPSMTNIYSKTESNDRYALKGYGLGMASTPFTSDFNSLLLNGWYVTKTIGLTNAPTAYEFYRVFVISGEDLAWVTQKAYGFGTFENANIYERHFTGGVTWSPWKQLATTDSVINYNSYRTDADLNTLVTANVYSLGGNCFNSPAPWGSLFVVVSGDVITQTCYGINTTFTRTKQGVTWYPWRQLAYQDNPSFTGKVNIFGSSVSGIDSVLRLKTVNSVNGDGVAIDMDGYYKVAKISAIGYAQWFQGGSLRLQTYKNETTLNEGITISASGLIGLGVENPQANLHSTGSTIIGVSPTPQWSQIGNSEMAFLLDEVNNRLQLAVKYSNGSQKISYIALS